jgi:hypothetical protein
MIIPLLVNNYVCKRDGSRERESGNDKETERERKLPF